MALVQTNWKYSTSYFLELNTNKEKEKGISTNFISVLRESVFLRKDHLDPWLRTVFVLKTSKVIVKPQHYYLFILD